MKMAQSKQISMFFYIRTPWTGMPQGENDLKEK